MDSFEFTSLSVDETVRFGSVLGRILGAGDAVLLDGELGSGKTHLAQGIASGMGVVDDVLSPTFNLVFQYCGAKTRLYHFDLYRLTCADELDDIDFYALTDEDSDGVALIEWAALFADEMPEDALEIVIKKSTDQADGRRICLSAQGARSQAILSKLVASL